tara:strand:- start:2460 stop:3182 length:723 start_codon:yes stop_codon:yes gene_type:complete
MLDFFLGTVEENAQRELANYNPQFGTRKKDLGDHLGDLLTGRGAAIDQAVKDQYVDKLDTEYGATVRRIKRELANDLTPEQIQRLNIGENTNAKKLAALTQDLQVDIGRRQNLIEAANLAGYGAEAAGLKTNEISGMLRQKADEKKEREEGKVLTERMRQEARSDKRYNTERMDRLEDLLREQRNRTADRQDQRELNRMQFDLQNRRLDMQEARNYRLDRQKAIMQIVQGFKQMGQAFAY